MERQSLLRDRGSFWPLIAVTAYVIVGYFGGISLLLLAANPWLLLAGTLLTAHAMVIAAYLLHECGHNTLFRRNEHNARLGRVLNWIAASAYARFEDIRSKHMRHHVDNTDVIAFDHVAFLHRHPRLRRLIEVLEWAYIPALPVMMHWTQILLPFVWESRRHLQGRVLGVVAVRSTIFLLVLAWNPLAAALWATPPTPRTFGNAYAAVRLSAPTRCLSSLPSSAEAFAAQSNEMGVKSLFVAPHSGQTQSSGMSSHRVPGGNPSSGSPSASS